MKKYLKHNSTVKWIHFNSNRNLYRYKKISL